MYRKIEDFLKDWKEEASMTIQLFELLTEDALHQKVYRQGRELGRIVWHIVQTIPEMAHRMGLFEQDTLEHEKKPPFLFAVIASYKGQVSRLAEAITQKWQDADLPTEIQMYGEMWTKAKALQVLVRHQIHHRGQMTVLMRQAGLKTVGLYGPTKDEWKAMGLPAME